MSDREQLIRQIAPAYVEQFNIDVERVGGYMLMAPADGGVSNVRRFLNALDALGFAVVPRYREAAPDGPCETCGASATWVHMDFDANTVTLFCSEHGS